jgi:hypothetical protein
VVVLVLGLGVDRRVALADVGRALARLADVRDERDHAERVDESRLEVVRLADDLPLERLATEDGPSAKPSAGSVNAAAASRRSPAP